MLQIARTRVRVQVRWAAIILAVAVLIPTVAFAQSNWPPGSEGVTLSEAAQLVDAGVQGASDGGRLSALRAVLAARLKSLHLNKWDTGRTICGAIMGAGDRKLPVLSADTLRAISTIGSAGLLVTGIHDLRAAATLEGRMDAGNEVLTGAEGIMARVAPALGALGPFVQGLGVAASACQIAAGCQRMLEGRKEHDKAQMVLGALDVGGGALRLALEAAALTNPVCLGALTAVTVARAAYQNRELIKDCAARGQAALQALWDKHCHPEAKPPPRIPRTPSRMSSRMPSRMSPREAAAMQKLTHRRAARVHCLSEDAPEVAGAQ